jgi:hypothetical protein
MNLTETESCELCQKPPTVLCEWGLYDRTDPMNKAKLCGDCSTALWRKCAGSVNAGLMHWTNKPIEKP